jgi:glutathione S-transferase
MGQLEFYTNPMSRGQIVRWMLEEVGEPYETHILDYKSTMKEAEYLAINPMGKVPAIRHDGVVVTEVAAICAYLADVFPAAGLAPPVNRRGDYYRWLFFSAGPVEAAFSNKAAGFEVPPERRAMFGYGTFELAIDTLEKALTGKTFVASDRFSAADLYVGTQLGFMLQFGLLEPRPAFSDYVARVTDRPAYVRAKKIDADLIAEMTAATAG